VALACAVRKTRGFFSDFLLELNASDELHTDFIRRGLGVLSKGPIAVDRCRRVRRKLFPWPSIVASHNSSQAAAPFQPRTCAPHQSHAARPGSTSRKGGVPQSAAGDAEWR